MKNYDVIKTVNVLPESIKVNKIGVKIIFSCPNYLYYFFLNSS